MKINLQNSIFTWKGGPCKLSGTLAQTYRMAEEAEFETLWLVNHFYQICPLGALELDMLESYTTLAFCAAVSPVTMSAALHFDSWMHNFGIQDNMRHSEETDAIFPHTYSFNDGLIYLGDEPRNGVDIDEELAARYPYKPASLPIARLEDETMWNW